MTVASTLDNIDASAFPPDELLISEDGVNLESDWHRIELNLLIELTDQLLTGRDDYYVGGNMFIYFDLEHARNRNFRGPDYFFVRGAERHRLREYWAVWKEDMRFPNVIFELLSPSTADMDRNEKKDVYERQFRTPEYFWYDPEDNILKGWRLTDDVYQPIKANEKGWLFCEQLNVWIGKWIGVHRGMKTIWIRFFSPEGVLVPTIAESCNVAQAQARTEQQRAETERRNAETERRNAETERRNAETERRNAEIAQHEVEITQHALIEQRRRADAAEAELAQLRKLLENKKD